MMLVLTYHKVAGRPQNADEFYTVTAEQLDRHLELLAQNGFQVVSPRGLLESNRSDQIGGKGGKHPALLTFDDGTVDHYEVVQPLLERYGCRAVFFVPTSKLNRPGYVTSEQAAELNRAGNVLGLHSHEHCRLDWLPEEDIRVQMEVSRQKLADLVGERPVMFAPPGGFIDRRVRNICIETGVQLIRTMRWGYNRRLDKMALECVPVNRFVTENGFLKVLGFERRQAWLYAAKEISKKMISARAYERLRGFVFKRN